MELFLCSLRALFNCSFVFPLIFSSRKSERYADLRIREEKIFKKKKKKHKVFLK